nr:NAD-dependent epimerase/dehydratase family protein [Kineosporia babensis]
MSESAQVPGDSAPIRVIAVDAAERIERLTAPAAATTAKPAERPAAETPAAPKPSSDVRDQAQDLEPGLEYSASLENRTEPEASDLPPGTTTSPITEENPRPRRRSYLPAGLTSPLKKPKAEEEETPSAPELGIVPGTDTGVDWRAADISSPEVVGVLDSADVVIHLATADDLAQNVTSNPSDRRLLAVRAAQAVSMAAAAVGARRFVAVTSAMVLGARPENPIPLEDEASCRADPDDGLVGDLLEVERVLERIPRVHPGLDFTLIRPAALVGPGVDTAVTRHFEAPRLLVLRGTGTRWQFCHVDDLAEAIWTAVTAGIDGPLTVGAAGSLDETQVETISGMRRLEVPAGLAFSTAERLHRVGVLNTPASELAYVVHPWVIGSTGLLAAGWQPVHGNEACLQGLLDDQRRRRATPGWRVDRRDAAAMGAAGAAVALLGTAAIVRQARSRQSKRRRSTLDP